ncbi:ABC transporter substrate-binding protein [Paenibacillus silviterrae]|uniref:ABC transporter substrate-binding protein n=1 Tax=Paenibacillus silviterrae TaxID=3242194 RepID=UPI002542E2CF|nr:ABC transporter substrate-binding protein [Paenibacillus chinjuensis]
MKRKLAFIALALSLAVTAAACSGKDGGSAPSSAAESSSGAKEVKITLLNSKGEIQQPLEEAAKTFKQDHPGISVEILTTGTGTSPFERASTLYASGNPPTITMLDPSDVTKFKDRILDLSKEKWVADSIDNSLTKAEDKVLDFPFAVEGFAFIYNKQVLDKAVGGSFDPATVRTTAELEELFKKIEASGKSAIHISPMDWSLGAHYLNFLYADQSKDYAGVEKFITELRSGNAKLASNPVFNGLIDTFDLMMKYNKEKASPLTPTYENGAEALAKGEVGLWFMGNWAWPNIKGSDTAGGKYGFFPVPVSNKADDYGNTQIATAVTKRLVVDKERSTPDQQSAAKKFLEWLVYEKNGQDFLVNKANIIPAFKSIALEPQDPLAKSIKDYMGKGKMVVGMTTLPADHWNKVGAAMQKYLGKAGDRATLAKDIESYWKSVK